MVSMRIVRQCLLLGVISKWTLLTLLMAYCNTPTTRVCHENKELLLCITCTPTEDLSSCDPHDEKEAVKVCKAYCSCRSVTLGLSGLRGTLS